MRFLVVDDSKTMRLIVRRTIRQAGFDDAVVEEAGDGGDALKILESQTFDIVLSDWNMVSMHGPELLQKLNERGQKVCFGFVTSEGSEEMRRRASELGARFLLAKPFSADVFRDTIRNALKST
jgi:two-component system chemotaxis response regulator CheY